MCGKLGQRLPDRLLYDPSDPSLVRVVVKVKDLDDNRPEFEKKLFTTGVRVDAPLQTEILKLTAVDKDPTALPIKYIFVLLHFFVLYSVINYHTYLCFILFEDIQYLTQAWRGFKTTRKFPKKIW